MRAFFFSFFPFFFFFPLCIFRGLVFFFFVIHIGRGLVLFIFLYKSVWAVFLFFFLHKIFGLVFVGCWSVGGVCGGNTPGCGPPPPILRRTNAKLECNMCRVIEVIMCIGPVIVNVAHRGYGSLLVGVVEREMLSL